MNEPEPRRRRPPVSCTLCRRRKIRCNRESPCSNCLRSRNGTCVYDFQSKSPSRFGLAQESTPTDRLSSSISRASTVTSHPSKTSPSTFSSQPSAGDVEALKSRVRELEEQQLRINRTWTSTRPSIPASTANVETTSSRIGGVFHVHHESRSFDQPQIITRSVSHKTRLFGQSHWINAVILFRDLFEVIEPLMQKEKSKALSGIQRCKSLAKVIKSQRTPLWPSPPRSDLPSKDIADELVDCYSRTIETVYRILHLPSFRRDYEAVWISDTEPDAAFLVQLKLVVLAIGATTYDEYFSLRASAIQWIYEAQTWLLEPEFKSRLSIQSLQTSLLLLLARETVDVGGDLVWISAGSLLRTAMYMGLHRDPVQLLKRSTFVTEMRRRLWNTIIEIALQSSITSGGPPLISLDDFNTNPPGNFDDDQLANEDPVAKSEDDFTQVSIAIALRKTFATRLTITKFLNDLGSHGTYEEALRLDAELRASFKTLRRTIQIYNSIDGPSPSPSQFELSVVDFIMHRYLSSLHVPFFGAALYETAFAYSRKVVIETSLKIWCAVYPSSSVMAAHSRTDTSLTYRNDLSRLTLCGSGIFRTVAFQASFLIAVELRTQLQEEDSLCPVPLRQDLLSVLDDAKSWSLRCIEAGETNIKGYLLMCVVAAQINGLMRGLRKDEFPELLIKAAEEAEESCLPILEEKVALGRSEEMADGRQQIALSIPPDPMEGWDFIISDALFNFDNAEPMNWVFDGEAM